MDVGRYKIEMLKRSGGTNMLVTDIIKIGSVIDTAGGTQLRVFDTSNNTVYCREFAYSDDTQDYGILVDDLRILSIHEIENIMHSYDGKNHHCLIDNL